MERILVIIAGGAIGAGAMIYLAKLVILRIFGVRTEAEVIAVKEPKQGHYVHTLRFVHNGKTVERDDKTGYSQPFSKGERLEITCSSGDPGNFEYTTALNKHIAVAALVVVMAVLIVLRFAFFVTDGQMEEDVKLY